MDKIQVILYVVVIIIAIGMFYVSYQNMVINKQLVKDIQICDAYIDGNHEKIIEYCQLPGIQKYIVKRNDQTLDINKELGWNLTIPSE